jgi:hypothetical protein
MVWLREHILLGNINNYHHGLTQPNEQDGKDDIRLRNKTIGYVKTNGT